MKNPGWDLIVGFREGSTSAFRSLFERYHRAVFSYVCYFINDTGVAEELVADTFIKLWNKRANFQTEDHVKAFLFSAAKNASIDYRRCHKKQLEAQNELLSHLYHNTEQLLLQDEVPIEIHLLEIIQSTLESLPKKQKEVMEMILFEGLSDGEVARRLNKSPKTIQNLKSIAVSFLRDHLDRKMLAPAIILFYFSLI